VKFLKKLQGSKGKAGEAAEEELMQKWTLRNGEEIYFTDLNWK
jgi:hypothetical protein